MNKILVGLSGLLLVINFSLAQKPNFSGTWAMDRARSFGLPPDVQQTMIVTQTNNTIELETKITNAKGESSIRDNYTIDGVEREFTPQGPTGPIPDSKGKRKANWLPNGRGIVVEEETTTQTAKGPTTGRLTRKWTISNDGELTIDLYIDDQRGSFETKRTFIKK
ncbi:MAG TPA: hypothetical protein VJ180_05185 [Pyrinomonadaceae bacterium]|nr:hypothetical protein [Pyrinomonadaceae bacterium]